MRLLSIFALALIATAPTVTIAQGLQQAIPEIVNFISTSVITFLIGIAFLIFIVNIVRYFIIDGSNENTRNDAKMYAIYAIFAFVTLVVFWGIVNIFVSSFGLYVTDGPTPDYLQGAPVAGTTGGGAGGCTTDETTSGSDGGGGSGCGDGGGGGSGW